MATAVFPNAHKNYINGEWVEASGGKGIENRKRRGPGFTPDGTDLCYGQHRESPQHASH